jgi:hypothetical protein
MKVVLNRRESNYGRLYGELIVQMSLEEFQKLTGIDVNRDVHLDGREFQILPEWNLRQASKARRDELVQISGLLRRSEEDVQAMLKSLDSFEEIRGETKQLREDGAPPEVL